jgi:hypothetical protein
LYPYEAAYLYAEADTLRPLSARTILEAGDTFEFSGMEMSGYILSVKAIRNNKMTQWWYPGTRKAAEARVIRITDFGQMEEAVWDAPQ